MVGNNKQQDGGCLNAVIDIFLVTDSLENAEVDLQPTYQGNQNDFYNFVIKNF